MSARERTLQKGEQVYAMGEAPRALYLVHSGLVTLQPTTLATDAQRAISVRAPQLFGEEVLTGESERLTRAVAQNSTRVLELSSPDVQAVVQALQPILKILTGGLKKKLTRLTRELIHENAAGLDRTIDGNLSIAESVRLATVVYRAALVTGKFRTLGDPFLDETSVVWAAFRKYCHWGLGEAPGRLDKLLKILEAEGFVRLEYIPDPVNPKEVELGSIHFIGIERLRLFSRYVADVAKNGETVARESAEKSALDANLHQRFVTMLAKLNKPPVNAQVNKGVAHG